MIFTVIILFSSSVIYGDSLDWKEGNTVGTAFSEINNEIEKVRCLDNQDEICKSNQDLSSSSMGHFLKKKNPTYSFAGNPKIVPFFQSFRQCPCACKMEYPLMDLGRKYFPRYLQTGVCKTDSCGSHHRCVEKKYKVAVIKQKDFSDQEVPGTRSLPPSLQDSWISETVSVSIACECVPIV